MSTGDQKCNICGQWLANCNCRCQNVFKVGDSVIVCDKCDRLEKRIEALEKIQVRDIIDKIAENKDLEKRVDVLEKRVKYETSYRREFNDILLEKLKLIIEDLENDKKVYC